MPFDAHAEDTTTDITQTTEETSENIEKNPTLWPVYLGLAVLVTAWVASIVTFGIPGLFIPALMMVPLAILMLIRLAWG